MADTKDTKSDAKITKSVCTLGDPSKAECPSRISHREDIAADNARTLSTHVQVFLLSTGDDPGSDSEMRGWIYFPDGSSNPPGTNFSIDFPKKSSWANENGGLGRLVMEYTASRLDAPLGFNVEVYEDDTGGKDEVLLFTIDFSDPANQQYRDGEVWGLQSWNNDDSRYRVNLQWQVTG